MRASAYYDSTRLAKCPAKRLCPPLEEGARGRNLSKGFASAGPKPVLGRRAEAKEAKKSKSYLQVCFYRVMFGARENEHGLQNAQKADEESPQEREVELDLGSLPEIDPLACRRVRLTEARGGNVWVRLWPSQCPGLIEVAFLTTKHSVGQNSMQEVFPVTAVSKPPPGRLGRWRHPGSSDRC
jgi:hypothetical protein